MKIQFLSEEEIDELYYENKLAFTFTPPYTDMPKNFVQQQLFLFDQLEKAIRAQFGFSVDVCRETWADLTIRMSVDVNSLQLGLVLAILSFVKEHASRYCVFCLVEEFDKPRGKYFGRFVFNSEIFLVETSLRNLWMSKINRLEVEW